MRLSNQNAAFRPQTKATIKVLNMVALSIALASLVLYVLSLALPCYAPGNEQGFGLLLFGAFGVFCGELPWLANPCYFAGLLGLVFAFTKSSSTRKSLTCCRIALLVSPVGILFAVMFLWQSTTLYGNHPVGESSKIEELRLGYWLWVSALVALSFAVFLRYVSLVLQLRKCGP
jgi:hypothetical protein